MTAERLKVLYSLLKSICLQHSRSWWGYRKRTHLLWFTMHNTSLRYLRVSDPSQKWDALTTHVSSEMNSELIYNLPFLVSQQSSTKEAVRCIVCVCDLSKSWASTSQIEILSPQFTVTVEGQKKVDGLESDMLPQVLGSFIQEF